VDEEIDGILSTQFDALNTRDRNDVIAEFRRLVGPHAATVNEAGCAFWLDMFNWNIHSAVGAFFDWQAPAAPVEESFNMTLCQDFTYADGENISPNTAFQKRWRLKNSGTTTWRPGTALRFIGGGSCMGERDRFLVESLEPGQICELMVTLTSPPIPGQYQGQWRLATPTGLFFGDIIWIVIQVEEGGIMGVTQAMKQLNHDAMTDARHSSAASLGWSCSSPIDSKREEEMSPDNGSPYDAGGATASAPSSLCNPFHLTSSPRRSDLFPTFAASSSLSPSSGYLDSEPSSPRPTSPQRSSPYNHRFSQSPVFAAFSPPSTSPESSSSGDPANSECQVDNPSSSLLAPPLIIPPSPPPYASATPSVGGFLVPPKLTQEARGLPRSPSISMSDDDS